MENAKNLFAIVLVVVVLGGGYVAFRYWNAGQMVGHPIGERGNFSPAICHVYNSGFSASQSSVIHTSNGNVREEFYSVIHGKATREHVIVTPDGIAYIWNDSSPDGLKIPYSDTKDWNGDLISHFDSCSPWWFPDDSYFKIPDLVEFTDKLPSES